MQKANIKENKLYEAFKQQITQDDLEQFLSDRKDVLSDSAPQYLALSISISPVDALAAIEQDPNKEGFQYYWEKPVDQFSMAASGEIERIVTTGENRFRVSSQKGKEILSRVHHLSGINHRNAVVHLFGGFSFFDSEPESEWEAFKSASFTLPRWMIIREGNSTILTFITEMVKDQNFDELEDSIIKQLDELSCICDRDQYLQPDDLDRSLKYTNPDEYSSEHDQWVQAIEQATDKIKANEFRKVVLARKLSIPLSEEISDTRILNQLRKQYPDCYSFLIRQDDESSFIGSTPERLASFNSEFVLTEGLAGSTSRGKTASEDAMLENALMQRPKDLEEHEIVLNAISENLTDYSDKVLHPAHPQIKKLSNVQHLFTPITAQIKKGVSRTEMLKTLHPTPAVGGFPRNKAVQFIRETEDFERGWYASPIGWINAHGNGEFVVAIRSGLIKKDEVQFFAGCGIVEDSDPEKEWEETNLKFIPMLSSLEYAGT